MATARKYLILTKEECKRRSIIESYCDRHIRQKEGAEKLGISIRQFKRLTRSYKTEGDIGLIHGLRGKGSNHHKDKEKEGRIIDIMNEEIYRDFGPTFLMEELGSKGINISDEGLRQLMIREGKREGKKQREMKVRNRRERRASKGEMIQYDGSYHHWFEKRLDEEFCLLVAIDDATGDLMQLWMGDNEGWESTVSFWTRYILKYGVPESIYVDKFATYKVNNKKATDDRELVTNFERCLRKLGCRLIKEHSPEAKGRVERANKTLQDRLVRKMRLAGINDVESANKYMEKVYVPRHNEKYGVKSEREGDKHRQVTEEEKETLKRRFSLEGARVVQSDYVVQYKNRYFQLKPEGIAKVYTKTKCLVQESVDGEIQILAKEKEIPYIEISAEGRRLELGMVRARIHAEKKIEDDRKRRQKEEERKAKKHALSKQKQISYRAQQTIIKGKISCQK